MRIFTVKKAAVWVAATLAFSTMTYADPIDPLLDPSLRDRQLRLDVEREKDREIQPVASPMLQSDSEPSIDEDSGPTFQLLSVRFTKSNYLNQEQLTAVVSPWLGKQVSFVNIQTMVAEVNNLYQQLGVYTATAILPKQRITEGVVLVRLVEGTLGDLAVEDNQYTQHGYIRSWIQHPQGEKAIDIKTLEGDILLYNRTNDQRLQAELRAGEAFGLTDIVVRVNEPKRDTLQFFADNYGYESTGKEEIGVLYRRQRLFTDGDRGLLYAQVSEGTRALSTNYNAPVGNNGWRLGGSASYTLTEVTEGDFSIADIKGDSYRLAFDASKLLWSHQNYWFTWLLSASHIDSKTEIAKSAQLSSNLVDTLQTGMQFNWLANRWQLSLRETISYVLVDDRLLNDDEKVVLHEGSITSIYQFTHGFYGLAQMGWQYANKEKIPGTVAFSLGGVYTSRGYKPGIISGDSGGYGQLELHYNGWKPYGQTVDFFSFYDIGSVESVGARQKLQSAGLGFSTTISRYVSVEAVVGRATETAIPNQDRWQGFIRIAYNAL